MLANNVSDDIDLLEGALLIAASLGSAVDLDECNAKLARLSERERVLSDEAGGYTPGDDPAGVLANINRVLFVESGFQGNEENYYDPENSFLNRVLEKRMGLPVTLSVVYMVVARRVGLELRGIGLPGHFVVGHFTPSKADVPSFVVDPFNGGQYLSLRECEAIIHGMSPGTDRPSRWLRPLSSPQILARILGNLKQIYVTLNLTSQLTTTIEMLLSLDPRAGMELQERAFLAYRAGKFRQAYDDIQRCLDINPRGEDHDRLHYYRRLFERLSVSHN